MLPGAAAMWLYEPLSDVLSSGGKVALLRVLCTVSAPFQGRELARRAGLTSGHTSVLLRELAASGLVRVAEHGRTKAYQMDDRGSPLVRQLISLFEAEHARYRAIVERLSTATPGLLSLVLFGSQARGDARPGSDTDLLFVVAEKSEQLEAHIRDQCMEMADEHLVGLSWVIVDLEEVREWERTGHQFWQNVLADGVVLRGKDLRSLSRQCQRGRAT